MPKETAIDYVWDPYIMNKGQDFLPFWEKLLTTSSERNILYILGKGFDPRMCTGLQSILQIKGKGKRNCMLIAFNEGPNSPSEELLEQVYKNEEILKRIISNRGQLITKDVQMWSSKGFDRHRTSAANATKLFTNIKEISDYSDIVVDISSLPRAIYFSLIAKLLFLLDNENVNINLHVVVCEDATLDKNISEVGVDESAGFIPGFAASSILSEGTSKVPKIWMPVLGENQRIQLNKIFAFVNPDEICPVLPHPSVDPRRSDNLLLSYRDLIFDQWLVEPRNIVYATEQNPFDVYRQIVNVVIRYNKALRPLGGCKVAISAQSSKLISIGALLAAYDLRSYKNCKQVGIVHIESLGYDMSRSLNTSGELFSLWIRGDCYAP